MILWLKMVEDLEKSRSWKFQRSRTKERGVFLLFSLDLSSQTSENMPELRNFFCRTLTILYSNNVENVEEIHFWEFQVARMNGSAFFLI